MSIEVAFFNVGETLIEETRLWEGWAAYLGVLRMNFVRCSTVERGEDHRRCLEHFRPGLDLAAPRRERMSSGRADLFEEQDLYPDVRACCAAAVTGLVGGCRMSEDE